VAQVGLESPRIVRLVGQGEATGVPKHVRVSLEAQPANPATGERIVPAARIEDVLTEGSTRATIRTMREGICTVRRFTLEL
jgi:hypothetical protein